MEHEASSLAHGSRFEDRYEILEALGSGAFGRVYRARQLSTGQAVAIKVLRRLGGGEGSTGSESERFRREMQICAELSHPNIVGLIDSGETSAGQLYAVFSYLPGETLEQALAREGALSVRETVRLMTQVLEALHYAHGQGIVHRDLKPANLMLTGSAPRRSAVVLDFGLGGLAEGRRREEWRKLTQTREFLGTPLYAAPEQLAGEPASGRSDLYAWGLVFLECVTGRPPFAEGRLSPAGGTLDLPAWLRGHRLGQLLEAVTARDAAKREVSAEALIEALEGLASGRLPAPPAASGGSAGAARLAGGDSGREGGGRKLAAIVNADVVGYSRLMAEDEDATVRTVTYFREQVEMLVPQHRGRLADFTGDNFLAEFPTAVEAVRCAIEIQRVLRARNVDLAPERRMQFRIGIHLGEVRVEAGRLFGTGVNVAARVQTLAAPGGICISGAVRAQLRGKLELELEALGEQHVKNIPEPVPAYRIALESPAEPTPAAPRSRAPLRIAAALGLLLLLAIAVATWRQRAPLPPSAAGTSLHSLAVLPFVNMSPDPDQAYFADGIAEELLNTVARFGDLRVVGRTSSFSFRDSDLDLRTIGEKLGADVILEGSVRSAGDRVRITAQLVGAADGYQLWSETYDRELRDIFAIQTGIATAIASALRVRLSPEQHQRLETPPTRNPEAYQAYLLGRQRLLEFTKASVAEGMRHLQQAIELDPKFALAGAALVDGYLGLFQLSDEPPGEMLARAQVAASRALQLDDGLAEVHVAVGAIEYFRSDFEAAEAAFRRALALNPNSVSANVWYGDLLGQSLGRYEESLALRRKAVELDPLSLETVPRLGDSLQWVGRFDESLSWYERSLEIDPDFAWGHELIGVHHWWVSGRLDEALVWLLKAAALNHEAPAAADVGVVLLELGDPVRGEDWLLRSSEQAPENFYVNVAMGRLEVHRRDEEAALEHVRKAFDIFPHEVLPRLRDLEVRAGRYGEARALYEDLFPELLYERDPEIDFGNYLPAIDLAWVLSRTGEPERADLLLDRALQQLEKRPRLGNYGYRIADVQVHAQRGETQKALAALRRAIDEGWRADWWYQLQYKPDLEPLHDEPEFQAMLAEIRADMAAQLEHVREMERSGELVLAGALEP